MSDDQDTLDAILFRLWIDLASRKPSRVMHAIMNCLTSDEYRAALIELAREERINLPEIAS